MTIFVYVVEDPDSSMDSSCRHGILSEMLAHGLKVKQYFSTCEENYIAPMPKLAYDGSEEVKYADPKGRLC